MTKEELDLAWVNRCLDGDVDAFGNLVEKYQRPVFNVILRMVGSYEDASEISQQVFLKAFENLGRFGRERRFFSWIYRIAINESINHIQTRRQFDSLNPDIPSSGPGPSDELEAAETSRALFTAIATLKPEHRAVVILRHFLNLSYRDAAGILEIPEKTVKSRLFTARQLLRDALTARGFSR
ncbi:MAG TPA: sigma-70 family RNA polymerase sigma factor [Thermoanaerobaculia bacterium]|nr:sigma-70 family RNA polymerase sigma factor [Thermoanaerobaculia bacterium]